MSRAEDYGGEITVTIRWGDLQRAIQVLEGTAKFVVQPFGWQHAKPILDMADRLRVACGIADGKIEHVAQYKEGGRIPQCIECSTEDHNVDIVDGLQYCKTCGWWME